MTISISIVLIILAISFILFITNWLKPDIIALLVLISLVFTGVITPEESFSGFSSFAVMAIAGLLIIGEGLERTGVVRWVARRFEKITKNSHKRLLMINTAAPGIMSGFINIVAASTFFIPIILRLSRKLKRSPSQVLMPMAFASLIGANLTLIGASHNLVVHSILEDSLGKGFEFFEFSIVGLVLLIIALIYIYFFSNKLLPGKTVLDKPKKLSVTANLIDVYDLKDRLFEVWVADTFDDEEIPLKEFSIEGKFGLTIIEIIREGEQMFFQTDDFMVREGDLLLVQGNEMAVQKCCHQREGLVFLGPPRAQEKYPISTAELAEAVVPPRSKAIGKTPMDLDFRDEYGLTPIAYYRNGKSYRTFAMDHELEEGDAILFYGPRDKIRDFDPEKELLIYYKPGEPKVSSKKKKLGPVAAAILIGVILFAALDIVPIAISAIAGAVLMVIIGIINPFKSYEAIDWKTLVLIGGMYPLGVALNKTGAADFIGTVLVNTLGDFGPVAVMGGIVLLTMLLTQPIHNAAVAIIMTPLAINAAKLMGSNPVAFSIAVLIACSATFILPYGHPAPMMVQEPGKYSAKDYLKFGLPLNILAFIVIMTVIPLLWEM